MIISIRVKVISVVLAVIFVFAGAFNAFAGTQKAYSEKSALAVSKTSISAAQAVPTLFKSKDFKVKAEKITDKSAVLSWNTNKNYVGYKVCRFNILTEKWDEIRQTTKNSYEAKDLTAASEYRFCILNCVTDEILGAVVFKTAAKTPELKIKERTSKRIVLSLGKHDKNETVVIYRKTGAKDYKQIAKVKGKSTYTDKKVKGNTSYTYKAKTITKNGKVKSESAFSSSVKTNTLISMDLPSVRGKTKTFAYYTAVTLKSSPQYKLLRSDKCTTDKKTGIRMYEGCYCVALGSYYGTKIGTKYRITFSSGNSINVVLCDQKANRHTDSKHQYAVNNKDIVEFYVQGSMIPKAIRGRGDYGRLSQFSGSVTSIEKYMD